MKSSKYYIVEKEVCGTCAHYHQHYTLFGGQTFRPLWYGHCRAGGTARRPAPDDLCPRWTGRADRNGDGPSG